MLDKKCENNDLHEPEKEARRAVTQGKSHRTSTAGQEGSSD